MANFLSGIRLDRELYWFITTQILGGILIHLFLLEANFLNEMGPDRGWCWQTLYTQDIGCYLHIFFRGKVFYKQGHTESKTRESGNATCS